MLRRRRIRRPSRRLHILRATGGVVEESTPEWVEDLRVPGSNDLPTVAATFVDEEYWDGEEASLSDLFSGVAVVGAGGLSVDGENSNLPVGAAAFLAAVNDTPCVIYLQVAMGALPQTDVRHLFAFLSAGQVEGFEAYIEPDGDEARNLTVSAYDGGYDNPHNFVTEGAHKIAFRFDGADVTRASVNGATITVAAAGETPLTVAEAYLGTNGSDVVTAFDKEQDGYLFQVVAVYPDQSQANMNALTAL